jgi:WD repeat-containing protein 68
MEYAKEIDLSQHNYNLPSEEGGNIYSNPVNLNTNEYIKTYTSASRIYGITFQNNKHNLRLACSTLETTTGNHIEVLDYDNLTDKIKNVASEETEFPASKILWSPASRSSLLAATSDILRLYKYEESFQKLNLVSALGKKQQNYGGPVTSMDWNKDNTAILGVCSIDTTCTIWDLNKNDVKTHLIAHDKEVYDISFGKGENTFLSTGADGSIRLFDLRALDTCSVIFDSPDQTPISRIAWNLNNNNFIAALVMDKNFIYIIDARVTNSPYAVLTYHSNVVNAISWSPNSNAYICSVGDDKNALIWDIQLISNRTEDPMMCYTADSEIDNVSWCESNDEWIGITMGNNLQLLKVK